MRIFKRKFKEELTEGMSIGECIITKVDDSQYGQFIVHRKVKEKTFPYLGLFPLLEDAVKFVQVTESPEPKYEYYLQSQAERKEGWDRGSFEVMGQLGWELCGIDSNITDADGKSMYIYKRILPLQQTNKFEVASDYNDGRQDIQDIQDWEATSDYKILRDSRIPNVTEFTYSTYSPYTQEIQVHFGKNGLGLTNELIIIGEQIKELSKKGLVYIRECFIDEVDDVYNFTFAYKPFIEHPNESDLIL